MTEQQTFAFRPHAAGGGGATRRNLVIEAGAGTGKTTAIVAEVLKLLLADEDVAPERMVLVTFTEKAAGEIADRIQNALAEIDAGADRWPANSDRPLIVVGPAARRAAQRQIARIDGLRSQTIHSFCQSLLRQYPIEAGIDPQFRIIEGFDRSLLYNQIFDDWVDDETRVRGDATAAREWEAVLEHCTYLFIARGYLFTLLEKRHLLLDPRYDIGDIAEYEPALIDAVNAVRPCDAPPPPAGSSIDDWIEYFAPIAAGLRQIDLRYDKRPREALKVLRPDRGTCVYDLLVSHRAAAATLSLTNRFIEKLDEEKRARGVLDFDDLLLKTRRLLDDPSVLERVRNQFDFIFVDEFQDTDRIQADILKLLATDAAGNYIPGKLVVVGDPKQSIYAFRRADPETYGSFTQSLLKANAAPQLLVDQYRSTPQLVETLNAICPPLFDGGERDPNVFQPEYHALRAARTAEGRCAPLIFLDGGDDAEQEAETIVEWIRSGNEGDLRRFALLFRRRTRMETFLDVFDRHRLPYVVPPAGLFLDRPAAVDLIAVLRAIAYRYDKGAAVSAARSPYFALTDAEIVLRDAPWQEFEKSMETFRDAAQHLTITQLIDHVVSTTGIEAVYHAMEDGGRALRHLEQVRAIAFGYDQKAGGSVRQFVEEIARRREVPEEVEPSLLDDTTNAIRILTIHGAKGLEFETVILPDIEFTVGGTGIDVFTVEDPPSLIFRNGLETLSGVCRHSDNRQLKEIASLRDKAETRRLFYVAITRAKSQVVIVCKPGVSNKGFGKFVNEIFGDGITFEQPVCGPGLAGRPAEAGPHTDLAPCVVPQPELITPLLPRAEIAIARRGSANRSAGILLHRVLERWDGLSDVSPLIAALAIEQAADGRAADLVRRRVARVASSATFRRIASAETIGREMPIAFLDETGALVERRLDRLIRENGTDTVVDYKSGEPAETRLARDREQVALYCRVVAQMTGRPCRGLLWYIDAENDVAIDVSS